jgi:hypothetical protein
MAMHHTTIGPINAKLTVTNVDESGTTIEAQAQIVAFGWDDSDPTTPTGYWYFGKDLVNGLAFISVNAIQSIGA